MKIIVISNLYELEGKITVHSNYFPIIAHSISFVKYQLKKLKAKPKNIYILPFKNILLDDTKIMKEISPKSKVIKKPSFYFKINKQNYYVFISIILITILLGIVLPFKTKILFIIQITILFLLFILYFKNRYYKNNFTLIKEII